VDGPPGRPVPARPGRALRLKPANPAQPPAPEPQRPVLALATCDGARDKHRCPNDRLVGRASVRAKSSHALAADDAQQRSGRLLLLGKGAVLAHRLARPLAGESDDTEQPPDSPDDRSPRCRFEACSGTVCPRGAARDSQARGRVAPERQGSPRMADLHPSTESWSASVLNRNPHTSARSASMTYCSMPVDENGAPAASAPGFCCRVLTSVSYLDRQSTAYGFVGAVDACPLTGRRVASARASQRRSRSRASSPPTPDRGSSRHGSGRHVAHDACHHPVRARRRLGPGAGTGPPRFAPARRRRTAI
jgi:hypothetical protein